MFFTYMFGKKPIRLVYEIWHTPDTLRSGVEISAAQARDARALIEERGQNISGADCLTYWLKLRNLKEWQIADFVRVLKHDCGGSFAIYTEDMRNRERAIIRVFSNSRGKVGTGARMCALPVEHIPEESPRRPLVEVITEILNS